jgi:hypothetical protein
LAVTSQNHEPLGKCRIGSWHLQGESVIEYGVDKVVMTVIGKDDLILNLK